MCVADITKNMNVKVFNLLSKINETRHIIWHETCKCICRLTASVCNSKQKLNEGKCECKELVDIGICECDKKYLDSKSCVCRNSLADQLVEGCTKVVDGDNKIYNETLNAVPSDNCAPCTLYVVLFAIFLTTSVIIGSSFVYFHWYIYKKTH